MAIALLEDLPEVRLGHFGSVFVTVWYAELTRRSLDALEKHQGELVAKYGQITLVSIVVGASKSPAPELRDRIKERAQFMRGQRRGNIVAVTNRGLGAIIARTFLAALSLINDEQMLIVKTTEEAAEMARGLPGQDLDVVQNRELGAELGAFLQRPATASSPG